jgi:glutathione S-transferase
VLLIGMLDSPYVRRVAVSLQLLGLPFEHHSLSVFRGFEKFRAINPVVKAPTLLCDDGTVLLESTLILAYAEAVSTQRSLLPTDVPSLRADLRVIGLGLAACEKSVQLVYERTLRPPEKQHEPWIRRVTGQLLAAFAGLETDIALRPPAASHAQMMQSGVTSAISWHFAQQMLPDVVPAARFPALAAFGALAEALPVFRAAAHGDGTCAPALTLG